MKKLALAEDIETERFTDARPKIKHNITNVGLFRMKNKVKNNPNINFTQIGRMSNTISMDTEIMVTFVQTRRQAPQSVERFSKKLH